MAIFYVFVDTQTGNIFRHQEESGLFVDTAGESASENLLASLTCGESPKFVMLNAYKILQPTYEFEVDDVFASSISEPNFYCWFGAYGFTDRCLTNDDVGQEEWFEQVYFEEEYL